MFRSPAGIRLALTAALLAPGCTKVFTKRAIEQFAVSMHEQDLDKLKKSTSAEFEQRALRQADAPQGLKMLKVPEGKVEIVSVEELGPGQRKAKVKVGEKGKTKELEYLLRAEGRTGRWVVDDVIMKQDTGSGIVERSVTEQMDLLLVCRELLLTWKDGSTAEKLSFCDDDLRTTLETLPPAWFDQMVNEIAGNGRQGVFRPDARMVKDKAAVIVPHTDGSLYLEMKKVQGRWMLRDLAIEPRNKESTGIRSLSKMTRALNQSARFLEGYHGADMEKLSRSASNGFYTQCLSVADLADLPIPVEQLLKEHYEAKQFSDRLELLLQTPQTTFMLTLREEEQKLSDGTNGIAEPRVDEVTLFEKDSKDVKRVSTIFLAHAVVHLYVDALRTRDLVKLRELSTREFCQRVWLKPGAAHFAVMPDPELPEGEPQIIASAYHGDQTELTIVIGDQPLTLVLQAAQGWVRVDDVLLPAHNRPLSLRTNLELMLPLHEFAGAAHRRDLSGLIAYSGDGLDRIVWRQVAKPPELVSQLVRPLLGEVTAIEPHGDWAVVRTFDGRTTTDVKLVRENDNYVIDDICLVPSDGGQRVELLSSMRQLIAEGQYDPRYGRRSAVVPAAAQNPAGKVERAVFETVPEDVNEN